MSPRARASIAGLGVVGVLAAACSGVATSTVYRDRTFDFTKLETFAVQPLQTTVGLSTFNARRIEGAIAAELARRGLRSVEQDPDFSVVLDTEFRVELNERTVDRYPLVILLVDMNDAHSERLLWRGRTEVELEYRLPAEADERLRNVVRGLLGSFPAGAD